MDYKEKLERAKELYPTANADQRYVLECLFPELAELRDERILEIIKHCIESRYLHTSTIKGISQKECFAWLEKQSKSYTKKDVDDAYLKGVCDAKSELEKQGEQKLANSAKTCKKSQRMISAEAKEALYDKPTWSEEDERNLQGIIDEIQANKSSAPSYDINVYDRYLSWLKSLKQKIGG